MLREGRFPGHVSMDTSLAGYLLNPLASDYSLARLGQEYGVGVPQGEAPEKARETALLPSVARMLEKELEEMR